MMAAKGSNIKDVNLNYNFDKMLPVSEWIFVAPVVPVNSLSIYVQELGKFFVEGKGFTQCGERSSYQIICILGDLRVDLTYRKRDYKLTKGDVIWLDCTDGYFTTNDGAGSATFLHFSGDRVAYYYDMFYRLNGDSPILKDFSRELDSGISVLMGLYREASSCYADINAVSIITDMITKMLLHVIPSCQKGIHPYVKKALSIMKEHHSEKITLTRLSSEINISKHYLSRLFKNELGTTIQNYLLNIRLNKAKELLLSTNLSIDEICSAIGFYNSSYFIKLFKRYEHITPSKFRNRACWGIRPGC